MFLQTKTLALYTVTCRISYKCKVLLERSIRATRSSRPRSR